MPEIGDSALATPQERLRALGLGAYESAARANAHAGVLAAASDPLIEPILRRVTRARLEFLTAQYTSLGLRERQAADWARLAYALYLGIAELRRADPDGEPRGDALRTYLALAVDVMDPEHHGPAGTDGPR